eukprot:Protomagalhaensia_wolfi_Nauph_80__824@NODE_1477_length_1511_cov_263_818614_g1143_i0_p1_GENE_NODE_1477_length_1511_cov_263_818614_g1143_i0NODE_1477_length_1511_cov_263_818614_g1143_i0_p1_ORF_typecomplete_len137_score24_24TPR_11/PF13414_6/0_049TPR_11/PF13414_6/0_06TPR_11/PF13414_6/62TPR_11/PF13414_6/0_0051TPR_9/PF13371_6/0_014TPR_9/PF13371_6/17TPR_9/PF13371_6/0_00059TPR_15/PF13429_6/8_8e05TPR_15/PF13429_6/0_00056TPR_16/PF13432_6/0_0072TPR_16/PF13432_6/1_1e02TPR_16/PF13432_6/0_0029TPR_14/PF13428_6/
MCDIGIRDAEEALKLNPDNAATWNRKGCLHAWRNEKNLAFQTRCEAIRLNPTEAVYWANRGHTMLKDPLPPSGPPESALRDIEKALELNDKCAWHWECKGIYWAKKGNREEAGKAYGRASELEPNNAEYKRLAFTG